MRVLFRRREPTKQEEVGALAVSLLAGLGTAALTYYLTRIFLARERLGSDD